MTRRFAAGEDPAADDPDVARRARDSHSDSTWSSSCSSQSTLDEWSSTGGGATAPADDSPSVPPGDDRDALVEANAEQIDTLGNTLDWLTKLVLERTSSNSETATDAGETADRGFQ